MWEGGEWSVCGPRSLKKGQPEKGEGCDGCADWRQSDAPRCLVREFGGCGSFDRCKVQCQQGHCGEWRGLHEAFDVCQVWIWLVSVRVALLSSLGHG